MAPKIAIIGAGPGGLCVANILQHNGIPFTVFEGDKTPHERNQGGTLDLSPQFGQLALKEAGLWEDFCEHSRPEADVMKIVNINGKVLWDGNGPDKFDKPEELSKPEIDREKLKDILLQNIRLECMRWGMHLSEVVPTHNGKYDLNFKEGITESGFDLVVGADGAWSKVRRLLTNDLPHYSGVSVLELWIDDVDNRNPWLSNYVGAGSCFCFDEGRAIMTQRLGDGSIRSYAAVRQPETIFQDDGLDFSEPDQARAQYVERFFGDAGADLKRMLVESDAKFVTRPLYMLPVGFSWPHRPGITLLGDAAHLMTPFGGVGVNAALADSLDLARTIVEASKATDPAHLDAAIQVYETNMFDRGGKFAAKTMRGLKGHFSADGAEKFAQRHRDAYAQIR